MEVFVLEINFSFNATDDTIYPVILRKDKEMILIDGGYAGFLPLLEQAAGEHGISFSDLTGILITHHDIDHMGVAKEIKTKYPLVKILATENEAPYISGKEKSLRLQQAENFFDTLPEGFKAGAKAFQEALRAMQAVPVDVVLSEEENLFNGEVEIIPTPGHMPGHISLYLKKQRILIAADAVVVENNSFRIANPQFTLDLPEALRSVRKIQRMDLKQVICYHGGVVEENVKEKLEELVQLYTETILG